MRISDRARRIEPSATMAAAARAKELKAQGVHVSDFSLGEPIFPTPEHICEAARIAIREGRTHYTPPAGIPELRTAIARRYREQTGIPYEPGQIIVSGGAKQSIHNVLTVLCGPGDEVIIPAPYWVSYSELVKLAGATPRIVPTSEPSGFKMTPEQLREAIGPRSRLLMLNSPCNPTGAVYSPDELRGLARVLLETELAVLSDEIYEHLIYGDVQFASFASLDSRLPERTLMVSGVSKSYAMTGWRIGWAAVPTEVASAIAALQSQETSNPCSISQHAALAALEGDQACVGQMRDALASRRAFVLERCRELPGVSLSEPEGAFYAFLNVSHYFGKELGGHQPGDSVGFCAAALEAAHVALVPGSAFGAEGYVRISFACPMDDLRAGFDALEELLTG